MTNLERARTKGQYHARQVAAQCPFMPGSEDRAAWLEAAAEELVEHAQAARAIAAPVPAAAPDAPAPPAEEGDPWANPQAATDAPTPEPS